MTTLHLHADPYYNLPPVTTEAPAGLTIAQMLDYVADGVERTNALHVLVKRNGHSHVVPAQLWHKVRPKPGTEISVLRTVEVGDARRAAGGRADVDRGRGGGGCAHAVGR